MSITYADSSALARVYLADELGAQALLSVIDDDLDSRIALVRLHPERILPEARKLVLAQRLRALDAIHLAVALDLRDHDAGGVVLVTRDADLAAAAEALGFELA